MAKQKLIRFAALYAGAADPDLTSIQTTYDRRHLLEGKFIKYICFRFPAAG